MLKNLVRGLLTGDFPPNLTDDEMIALLMYAYQIISDEAERLGHKHVELIADQANIPALLKEIVQANDIIITMGAGNIWRQCEGIYEANNN